MNEIQNPVSDIELNNTQRTTDSAGEASTINHTIDETTEFMNETAVVKSSGICQYKWTLTIRACVLLWFIIILIVVLSNQHNYSFGARLYVVSSNI
jgi:hypothetical protein